MKKYAVVPSFVDVIAVGVLDDGTRVIGFQVGDEEPEATTFDKFVEGLEAANRFEELLQNIVDILEGEEDEQ